MYYKRSKEQFLYESQQIFQTGFSGRIIQRVKRIVRNV